MQTFLTDLDWRVTARQLDYKRLGKQRVECKQILNALGYAVAENGALVATTPSSGWRHHPCVAMWRGSHEALAEYMRIMVEEWIRRGYQNTMLYVKPGLWTPPPWYADERIYASHRSNLLRKKPEHYGQFGWTEGPELPYFYPTMEAA